MRTRQSRYSTGRLRHWFTGAVIGLWISGCGDLFGPSFPDGTIPLSPVPAEYEAWWKLAERCSGVEGSFARVEWRVLPGHRIIPHTGGAVGAYYSRGHRIVLVEGRVHDGYLVRHEMLHALLRSPGHPRRTFVEECGGLVSCGGPCLEEADRTGPPFSIAPFVTPRSMRLSAEVLPNVVSLTSGTHGCTTIVVHVENDHHEHVQLDLSRIGFGWFVEGIGGGGGGPTLVDRVIVFPPRALRSYAFECPRLIAQGLRPGGYRVGGTLGNARTDLVDLTLER